MRIKRNCSFNLISKSMSASHRRARSRTRWTTSGKQRCSERRGSNQEIDFIIQAGAQKAVTHDSQGRTYAA